MPASAHSDLEFVLSCEPDSIDHVGGPVALDDHTRPPVDHAVPDAPRRVVTVVAAHEHPSEDACLEFIHRCLRQRRRVLYIDACHAYPLWSCVVFLRPPSTGGPFSFLRT